jgi:hypothetical protein
MDLQLLFGQQFRGWHLSTHRRPRSSPTRRRLGLVWEMEDSSGWKRIEGDFGKF